MQTLSGNLPAGLRPVAKRLANQGEANSQTRRIVIPRAEKSESQSEPPPVPKVIAPQKFIPMVRHFYLYPCVDPSLLGLFPQGIRLSHEWLYIGRNPYNEADAFLSLVLNRDEISMVHAALMEFHGKVYVADLGSSNGTKIIRNQVVYDVGTDPVELNTEDVLGIASILFRVAQH